MRNKNAQSNSSNIQSLFQSLLIKWVPFAIGGREFVTAIADSNVQHALLALVGTGAWGLITYSVSTFFKRLEAEIDEPITEFAKFVYDRAKEYSRSYWLSLPLFFSSRYYQSIIFLCRDFETPKSKIRLSLKPNLEDMFVSICLAYCEEPDHLKRIPGLETFRNDRFPAWNIFSRIQKSDEAGSRIVILGNPGSGKTTVLRHFAMSYACHTQRKYCKKAPRLIPILLYLRDLREQIVSGSLDDTDLATIVENQEWIQELKPQKGWFKTQLRRKKCLVLLDGLDEVADEQDIKKVGRWVDAQIQKYQGNFFIMTSRPFGYEKSNISRIKDVLAVQPLEIRESEEFIHKWYLEFEMKSRGLTRIDLGIRKSAEKNSGDLVARIRNKSYLRLMSRNPLLLTMVAIVHSSGRRLPSSRAALYHEICQIMLSRQQDEKGIKDVLDLDLDQKLFCLETLAYKLMINETERFSIDFAEDAIQESLSMVLPNSRKISTKKFVDNIQKTSSLIVEREVGRYEFSHRSFLEYLTSHWVGRTGEVSVLLDNIERPWWSETIRLFAANYDPSQIILHGIEISSINSVKIAYECLVNSQSHKIDPSSQAKINQWTEKNLDSPDSNFSLCAAEIKLLDRVDDNNLEPLGRKTAISYDFITCGEYQIFLNEKRQAKHCHQPDHWKSYRFNGDTKDSIVGVRPSDAMLFCQWLTERHLGEGLQYRLPKRREEQFAVEEKLVEASANGSWCKGREGWEIYAFSSEKENYLRLETRKVIRSSLDDARKVLAKFQNSYRKISSLYQTISTTGKLKIPEGFLEINIHEEILEKYAIDQNSSLLIISSFKSFIKALSVINEVRTTGKSQKFVVARNHLEVSEKILSGREISNLSKSSSLSKVQHLRDMIVELKKVGRSRIDDRYQSRVITLEFLRLLGESLSLGIAHLTARVRDLHFILDEFLGFLKLPSDFESDLRALEEFKIHLEKARNDIDYRLKTSSFSSSFKRLDELANYIGYTYTANTQVFGDIIHVSNIMISRSIPQNRSFDKVCTYLLAASSFWFSMGCIFANDAKFRRSLNLSKVEGEQNRIFYMKKREKTLRLYVYMLLLSKQVHEGLPAWGTIRIMRETLSLDVK